jgi:hypothetical protein
VSDVGCIEQGSHVVAHVVAGGAGRDARASGRRRRRRRCGTRTRTRMHREKGQWGVWGVSPTMTPPARYPHTLHTHMHTCTHTTPSAPHFSSLLSSPLLSSPLLSSPLLSSPLSLLPLSALTSSLPSLPRSLPPSLPPSLSQLGDTALHAAAACGHKDIVAKCADPPFLCLSLS